MLITEELGGADQDVKQYFFSLSPSEVRNILEEYCAQFGTNARNDANSTIEKWRVGTVRMSGMVAARLFKLLPPRMPLSEKYRLIENLWNRVGPSSRNTLYVGPDASIDQVVEIVRSHIDKVVAEYRVPESLEQRFKWLAEGDSQVKQNFLNYLRNNEKLLVENATRVRLPVMVNHLRGEEGRLTQQLKQVLRIGKHEVLRIGKHEVELVLDKRAILRAVIFNAFQQLKQVLRTGKHAVELVWDKRAILRAVIFNAFQQLKQVLRTGKHEIELVWDKRAILRAVIFNAFQQLKQVLRTGKHAVELVWDKRAILRAVIFNAFQQSKQVFRTAKHEVELVLDKRASSVGTVPPRPVIFNAFQKKRPAFWRWALGLLLLLGLATYSAARIFQSTERSSAPAYTGPEPFPSPVNLPLPNTAMPPLPTVLPDVRSPSQSTPEGSSATVKTGVTTPPQLPAVSAPIAPESKSRAAPKSLPEKQTSSSTGPDSPDTRVTPRLGFYRKLGQGNTASGSCNNSCPGNTAANCCNDGCPGKAVGGGCKSSCPGNTAASCCNNSCPERALCRRNKSSQATGAAPIKTQRRPASSSSVFTHCPFFGLHELIGTFRLASIRY